MIRNFKHKALQRLYLTGNSKGIVPAHIDRILARLERLDNSNSMDELPKEWKCHPLFKDLEGCHAIWITPQWRIVFRFKNGEFCDIDYVQYH